MSMSKESMCDRCRHIHKKFTWSGISRHFYLKNDASHERIDRQQCHSMISPLSNKAHRDRRPSTIMIVENTDYNDLDLLDIQLSSGQKPIQIKRHSKSVDMTASRSMLNANSAQFEGN
jgi:hypothetical protein